MSGEKSLGGLYKEDEQKLKGAIKLICFITFPRAALLIKSSGVKRISQNTQLVNGLVAD